MAFWEATKSLFTGNFSDAANYLFIDDEAIETRDQVAKAQQEYLDRQKELGLVDDSEYVELSHNINDDVYKNAFSSSETSPWGGFVEGAKEGAADELDFASGKIADTLNGAGKFVWKSIPLWVWIVAVIAAAIYFRPLWAPLIKRR